MIHGYPGTANSLRDVLPKNKLEVKRNLDKSYEITINYSDSWQLLTVDNKLLHPSEGNAVWEGKNHQTITLTTLDKDKKWFFALKTENDQYTQLIAECLLPLNGTNNFQDLGGILNRDGKSTKYGLLYRSDNLGSVTKEDLDYLESINLKTIIDLRSNQEKANKPDRLPQNANYIGIPLNIAQLYKSGALFSTQQFDLTAEQAYALMLDIYKKIVVDYRNELSKVFNIFIESNEPLLFHCTAGKDRTGVITALLLDALRVDRNTIRSNYMLSEANLRAFCIKYKEELVNLGMKPEASDMILATKPEYIEEVFKTIDNSYGGIDKYLEHHLKVNTEKLRDKYLE